MSSYKSLLLEQEYSFLLDESQLYNHEELNKNKKERNIIKTENKVYKTFLKRNNSIVGNHNKIILLTSVLTPTENNFKDFFFSF